MGLYLTGFWMPQSIKAVAVGYSNTAIGILVMVPSAVSLTSDGHCVAEFGPQK